MNPENTQYQEQGQKQTLKKIRYVGGTGMECPHCGESVVRHVADRSMLTIVPSVVHGWYQVRSFAPSVVMALVASSVPNVVR